MAKYNKYTDAENKTIISMKAEGKANKEIGERLSRPAQQINAKWQTLRKTLSPKKKLSRLTSTPKREPYPESPPEKTAPHRPMIALVGTPAEVTATIRELFS